MASPGRRPPPDLTSANTSAGANQLIQSLNKLSISTAQANAPSKSHQSRLSKTSPDYLASPKTGTTPRSPAIRTGPNDNGSRSRSATPTLVRKTSTTSLRSSTASTTTPFRAPSRKTSATNLKSPNTSKPSPSTANFPLYIEKSAPSAASIAKAYFKKELELLHSEPTSRPTDTIIILHDACYGHRFSRPRTSKGTLNTIVERPERIQASVLGVSAAYVRLGERHSEGKVPIHPQLDPASLPSIPFRIVKTERKLPLDSPAVTNVHGTKWMEELKIMCDSAETKLAANGSELRRPEMNRGPDSETPQKLHEGDLYLCSESQDAFEGSLGAVCEAVDIIFSDAPQKRAFVAVRPPGHHCSASFPSGFCWVNNVQVGIMHGVLAHGLTHAAIIDFDLHHGDGSQAITWAHNKRGLPKNVAAWKKTPIGYFSLHDINSYPCEWGDDEKVKNASLCIDNAHGQNIWNVHLQEWKTEVDFWRLYQSKYSILLEKARNFLRLQTERLRAAGQVPNAAIFLSAGFDASEWEGAGMQRHKVNVPTEFYARITRDVVKMAAEEGLGVEGRIISVLEGGYSDRALYSGVLSHLGGLAGGEPIYQREDGNGGFSNDIGRSRVASVSGSYSRRSTLSEVVPRFPYDPNWWSASELDKLDGYTPSPTKPARMREAPPPTYCSPTQASEAKLTEIAKIRRSVSGVNNHSGGHNYNIQRVPTPPPPDVPWTAAAYELSRLLIPNNRQINSCKHEELNVEAAKAKKERQSLSNAAKSENGDIAPSVPSRPSTRMSLRERKPTNYTEPDDDIDKARRKTVAGALATEKAAARGKLTSQNMAKQDRQANRRLSTASTMTTATHGPESTSIDLKPYGAQVPRPATSASVRTQNPNGQNGRRSRIAGPTQKDGTRVPRVPKAKAVAPAKADTTTSEATPATMLDVAGSNNTSMQAQEPTAEPTSEPAPQPSSENGGELDKITDGMKRIKINVLTKEKKEARQREAAEKAAATKKAAEEKHAATEQWAAATPLPKTHDGSGHAEENTLSNATHVALPPSSPPGPLQHQPTGSSEPNASSPAAAAAAVSKPPPIPIIHTASPSEASIPTIMTPTIESNQPPSTGNSPATAADESTPKVSSPQTPDPFIPYRPDGPPAAAIPLTGPVRILDPNTGTPAPRPHSPRKQQQQQQQPPPVPPFDARALALSPDKKGFHGFTATSPIPFAAAAPMPPRPATAMQDGSGSGDAGVGAEGKGRPSTSASNVERVRKMWEAQDTPGLRHQV